MGNSASTDNQEQTTKFTKNASCFLWILSSVAYHPKTNPIEEFFSQLKHYIRKKSPQNYNEIRKYKNLHIFLTL